MKYQIVVTERDWRGGEIERKTYDDMASADLAAICFIEHHATPEDGEKITWAKLAYLEDGYILLSEHRIERVEITI